MRLPEMSESQISRERFELLLPFYLNGTLDSDEQQWMQSYVHSHPEVVHAMKFAQQLQQTVVAQGQAQQPAQHRVDRIMARAWPQPPAVSAKGALLSRPFGWSWLAPFAAGMAAVLVVWGLQNVPTASLHTDALDGRADIRVALAPGIELDDAALLKQLQAFNSEVVSYKQIDGRDIVEIDLNRGAEYQHALIQSLVSSGQIDGHELLASQ